MVRKIDPDQFINFLKSLFPEVNFMKVSDLASRKGVIDVTDTGHERKRRARDTDITFFVTSGFPALFLGAMINDNAFEGLEQVRQLEYVGKQVSCDPEQLLARLPGVFKALKRTHTIPPNLLKITEETRIL